tara:strand:- start:883 stop:1050 length:168 start_codon:yes stop_codon:yes gene_type:complete
MKAVCILFLGLLISCGGGGASPNKSPIDSPNLINQNTETTENIFEEVYFDDALFD